MAMVSQSRAITLRRARAPSARQVARLAEVRAATAAKAALSSNGASAPFSPSRIRRCAAA
jgi:hypothetical protein